MLLHEKGIEEFRQDYPKTIGGPGIQRPAVLRETLFILLERMVKEAPEKGKNLRGICLAGHGPSIVFLDRQGEPLSDVITWQDSSAEKEAHELKLQEKGFQKDGTSYEAKILHFLRNTPELLQEGVTVLYPKDYLVRLLTGESIIDRSTASTITFFMDPLYREPIQNLPRPVPVEIFPRVIDPWEEVGKTGNDFSKGCGLPDGLSVLAGGIDAYCEALGAGAIEAGDIVDGTGTSTCISLCGEIENLRETSLSTGSLNNDLHIIPGRSIMIQMMSSTGGALEWILRVAGRSRATLPQFLKQVDTARPTPLLFLPYLRGERSPVWDEKARGVFAGLTEQDSTATLVQAVLQGVAFGVRQNLEILGANGSIMGESVRATGGGAGSGVWLQIKADVTGKTYRTMKIKSSAALGSALLAAYGMEKCPMGDLVDHWVESTDTFYPDRNRHDWYSRLFGEYKKLYELLKTTFHTQALLKGGEEKQCVG